jgi:hypothetical protein
MRHRAQMEKERVSDIVDGLEGSSFRNGHPDMPNREGEGEDGALNSGGDELTPEPETPNTRSAILPPSTPPTPQSPAASSKTELPPDNIGTAPALSETSLPHRTSQLNGAIMPPIKPIASPFQILHDCSPTAHHFSQTIPDTHSLTTSDSAQVDPLSAENVVCKRCQLELRRENDRAVVVMFG